MYSIHIRHVRGQSPCEVLSFDCIATFVSVSVFLVLDFLFGHGPVRIRSWGSGTKFYDGIVFRLRDRSGTLSSISRKPLFSTFGAEMVVVQERVVKCNCKSSIFAILPCAQGLNNWLQQSNRLWTSDFQIWIMTSSLLDLNVLRNHLVNFLHDKVALSMYFENERSFDSRIPRSFT